MRVFWPNLFCMWYAISSTKSMLLKLPWLMLDDNNFLRFHFWHWTGEKRELKESESESEKERERTECKQLEYVTWTCNPPQILLQKQDTQILERVWKRERERNWERKICEIVKASFCAIARVWESIFAILVCIFFDQNIYDFFFC